MANKKNNIKGYEIDFTKRLRLIIVGSITMDCREGKADPMTEAFLQMAGVFSQLELAMIRARVRSGMANAKAKGKVIGRPQMTTQDIPQNFMRHYPSYKAKQLNISEFARVCDMSRTTIYKYLSLLENLKGAAQNRSHIFIYFALFAIQKTRQHILSRLLSMCLDLFQKHHHIFYFSNQTHQQD